MAGTGRETNAIGWSPAVLAALLGLAALLRVGLVLNHALDPDESQHLHAAWLVAQGQVPFRDFWEHHVPLFYYAAAPLTRWFAESPAVYSAGRAVMTGLAGVALLLTYRVGRRLSRETALAAALMLALLPQFAEDTTETRPDVPALVAWLATLLALLAWRERGRLRSLWLAGLGQGVALAFTLKAGYGTLGAGLFVVLAILAEEPAPGRRAAEALGWFGLGAVLPSAAVLAWLAWSGGAGILQPLVAEALVANLRFVDFTKTWPLARGGLGFVAVALLGVGWAVRRHRARVLVHPVHGPLLGPAAVIAAVLALPWTPAVYDQAWLPVLPILAVYAAWALVILAGWAARRSGRLRWGLVGLALLGAIVVPAGQLARNALRDETAAQLGLMRTMLWETCPGDAVLDGTALYVFRPAAYRYGVLVTGIREWVARGMLSEQEIAGDMARARAPVAHVDRRVRGMVGAIARFLAAHYVPGEDGLLVAGASIPVPGTSAGGRAYVDLLISGPYRLSARPGIEVAVDRAVLRRGWVGLRAGRHEVTWVGPPGTIRLAAATCAERRALAGSGSSALTVP